MRLGRGGNVAENQSGSSASGTGSLDELTADHNFDNGSVVVKDSQQQQIDRPHPHRHMIHPHGRQGNWRIGSPDFVIEAHDLDLIRYTNPEAGEFLEHGKCC